MNSSQNTLVIRWLRLPLLVRTIVGGLAVFFALQIGWNGMMIANLMTSPNIPWSMPLAAVYLWVVFQFFNGRWGSVGTAEARRNSMGARRLSRQEWTTASVATGLVTVFIIAATLLTYRMIEIPVDDYPLPEMPWWTLYSTLLMVAIVAGVSEEAGFRGYMMGPLEKRYGPMVAITISSFMFWIAHLNHASGFARFVPLMIMGTALALLTRSARSIIPAIIAHASADAIIFICGTLELGPRGIWYPEQLSETGLDTLFWADLVVVVVSGMALFFLLRRMSQAASRVPSENSSTIYSKNLHP
jgi:membrane protease YdiL (CAAX protease family)